MKKNREARANVKRDVKVGRRALNRIVNRQRISLGSNLSVKFLASVNDAQDCRRKRWNRRGKRRERERERWKAPRASELVGMYWLQILEMVVTSGRIKNFLLDAFFWTYVAILIDVSCVLRYLNTDRRVTVLFIYYSSARQRISFKKVFVKFEREEKYPKPLEILRLYSCHDCQRRLKC